MPTQLAATKSDDRFFVHLKDFGSTTYVVDEDFDLTREIEHSVLENPAFDLIKWRLDFIPSIPAGLFIINSNSSLYTIPICINFSFVVIAFFLGLIFFFPSFSGFNFFDLLFFFANFCLILYFFSPSLNSICFCRTSAAFVQNCGLVRHIVDSFKADFSTNLTRIRKGFGLNYRAFPKYFLILSWDAKDGLVTVVSSCIMVLYLVIAAFRRNYTRRWVQPVTSFLLNLLTERAISLTTQIIHAGLMPP